MQQIYKQPQARKQETEEVTVAPVEQDAEAKAQRDSDIDALLDEIDGVLEVNAAEFVQGYVQEGGE